ncbi:arabinose operon transcriptional regulator AraC [Endozoicomonas sp. OPT23]|uniref:arabinose operon transcriptional regulator AraC n=1 Tax=Endozoicomonas sp. OPT23 TaxID=2072845 RepID=UPI00129A5DAA|nr:arabinose operon transcriptional regulator AraC [Endozoicomonas sp. OPT23]MRI35126.1 arabinose operon transcriptional regulator AraC [Endozoicomonas sp. OPT23]
MENITRTMNAIQAAKQYYNFISTPYMDEVFSTHSPDLFPDMPSLSWQKPDEIQEAVRRILDQPRIPELSKRWRPVFEKEHDISQEEANQFLQQFISSMEGIDFIVDYRCNCSYTLSEKGQWSDYRVYRPGRKSGWGLQLTVSGKGVYNGLRSSLEVGPGDLVLLSPDAFYDYHRHPDADSWGCYWLVFLPDTRFNELLDWPDVGSGIHHLSAKDSAFIDTITPLFEHIREISQDSDPWAIRLRYNLLEQALIQCKRLVPEFKRSVIDHRVLKAIEYIEKHFRKNITVKEIAEEACISVSSLIRLFKQHTGLTVIELRNEKRMALACEKLTHTRISIAEIAELAGYSDQLYFSRCFHRHFRMSPSAFRKQYLNQ